MSRVDLSGVSQRLIRAVNYLELFARELESFCREPATYFVPPESYEHGRPEVRVEEAHEVPAEWNVLIADCVHNLRSSLDHLAFQLMVANHGEGRLSTDLVKSSAFPIFGSGPKFAATVKSGKRRGQPTSFSGLHKIRGCAPEVIAIIESLQPYHARKNPGTRRLWQLHQLSNTEKHRLFPLVASSFEVTHLHMEHSHPIDITGFESKPGRLKKNAVVATFSFVGPAATVKMHMKTALSVDVTFGKGYLVPYCLRGESVIYTLHSIFKFVADEVIPPLIDYLGMNYALKIPPLHYVDRSVSPWED